MTSIDRKGFGIDALSILGCSGVAAVMGDSDIGVRSVCAEGICCYLSRMSEV